MSRIVTVEEVKALPIGTLVYMRKQDNWRRTTHKIAELNGLKVLVSVHTRAIRTIKDRRVFHYEIDGKKKGSADQVPAHKVDACETLLF